MYLVNVVIEKMSETDFWLEIKNTSRFKAS